MRAPPTPPPQQKQLPPPPSQPPLRRRGSGARRRRPVAHGPPPAAAFLHAPAFAPGRRAARRETPHVASAAAPQGPTPIAAVAMAVATAVAVGDGPPGTTHRHRAVWGRARAHTLRRRRLRVQAVVRLPPTPPVLVVGSSVDCSVEGPGYTRGASRVPFPLRTESAGARSLAAAAAPPWATRARAGAQHWRPATVHPTSPTSCHGALSTNDLLVPGCRPVPSRCRRRPCTHPLSPFLSPFY